MSSKSLSLFILLYLDLLESNIPIDYISVILILISFEIFALRRNWSRWKRNEYYHQFQHNIGIGNLKEVNKITMIKVICFLLTNNIITIIFINRIMKWVIMDLIL